MQATRTIPEAEAPGIVSLCAVRVLFSDAVVAQPGVEHLFLVEDVAAVDQDVVAHEREQLRPVGHPELFPLRDECDGIGALCSFVHRTCVMHPFVADPAAGFLHRHGVVDPNRGARLTQQVDHHQCRRFAHVVRFGLEREAPYRDGFSVQVAQCPLQFAEHKFEAIRDSLSDAVCRKYDEAETYHDGKWVMFEPTNTDEFDDYIKLLAMKRKPNRK